MKKRTSLTFAAFGAMTLMGATIGAQAQDSEKPRVEP